MGVFKRRIEDVYDFSAQIRYELATVVDNQIVRIHSDDENFRQIEEIMPPTHPGKFFLLELGALQEENTGP